MSTALAMALVVLALARPSLSAAVDPLKTYANAQYAYRLSYPATWHISLVAGKGGPTLYNYDLASAPGHGLLPEHGAEIFVLPHGDLSKIEHSRTAQEWATADVRRFSQGNLAIKELENVGNPEVTDVSRVSYDSRMSGGDGVQRHVAYYFLLGGEILKVELTFWKGDPKAESCGHTLLSIFKSIRVADATPN